jgi:endonuclease/exonuclease/phosphatase family metal-dependent hydrolase
MPAAIRALDPDVVCLQEVWTARTRAALVEALGPDLSAAQSDRGGLLLLSRWPIREEAFTPYPVTEGLSVVERLAGKGVLDVVVETPAGPLRVVSTHMVAFDVTSREAGLPVLLEVVARRPDLPLVLAGDFNLRRLASDHDALSPSYRRLLDAGCTDAAPPRRSEDGGWEELDNTHVGWPRREGDAGWWRPDHVLFRSAEDAELRLVACRMALHTPETALSDHNLMLAELRLLRR